MDLLGAVVLCMILLYARDEIKVGRLTIGLFGAFTFALFKAYEPIKHLGNIYQLYLAGARDVDAGVFVPRSARGNDGRARCESSAAICEAD